MQERHTIESRRRRRPKPLWIVLLISSMMMLVGILPNSLPKAEYPVEEVHAFWEENLKDLFDQLHNTTYRLEIVNSLIRERHRLIAERYENPDYATIQYEQRGTEGLLLSSWYEEGQVIIGVGVPNLMDTFFELQADKYLGQREIFDNTVVIGYLHELDHRAFDFVEPSINGFTCEERVLGESIAWAKTVQSVELLKHNYSLHFLQIVERYYTVWLKVGRKENSDEWRKVIKSNYC